MPPADNSHHLAAAAAARSQQARRRAEDTLLVLRVSGGRVTVARLARDAKVSRSWLYTQPDLIAAVQQLAERGSTPRSAPASEKSLQVRLAAALARNERLQKRVDALTEQNKRQRQQLERAYAELRRLQIVRPTAPTPRSGGHGPSDSAG
ncbi:DUF6262 family protein [Catenulispora subtropica]|uniref:DUF6262 family protein n=1 Tax=Catenulispora subtropica TaxID=450798 RepID=A0ABP5CFY7_9ACTN